ncbi:hypothetical protein D9619_007252 [Psilocybe cf. subviscida]|uniref:Uncharacterized protein n=1 Tax=Psilocybe cf. subviscida TaxID=2480587 RepID=A0A8H5EWU6_9AGAR|nr:hypothetical protein D9619_007252 [Psilocybe cf. subviscida]
MMLLSWMFFNILAIVGCHALPVGLNGGSVELPSKSLIILVVVGTLLAILSFMAVIAYWNATLFVACCSRPTDAIAADSAGRAARSVETNRR